MEAVDFGQLYERYAPDVMRFALYLTGSRAEAEDITSETFVRAWMESDAIRVGTVKARLDPHTGPDPRQRLAPRHAAHRDGADDSDVRPHHLGHDLHTAAAHLHHASNRDSGCLDRVCDGASVVPAAVAAVAVEVTEVTEDTERASNTETRRNGDNH
jgi:hypothetical protein